MTTKVPPFFRDSLGVADRGFVAGTIGAKETMWLDIGAKETMWLDIGAKETVWLGPLGLNT